MRDNKSDIKLKDPYHVTNPPTERKQVVRARERQHEPEKTIMENNTQIDIVKQIKSLELSDDIEAIEMILSGHITHGSEDGALIHVDKFNTIATDIKRYYEEKHN